MDLDKILKRRALRLKAELTENGPPKSGFMSTIYPAMDYGKNAPHTVKTPASVPSFNDAEGEPDFAPEKPGKQVDEPGPSKSPSFSVPAIPGQSAMVPAAHKRAAFELGYFGEGRSERFINRCVELITGVKKLEQEEPEEEEEEEEEKEEKEEDEEDEDEDEDEEEETSESSKSSKNKLLSIIKKFKAPKAEPSGHD